jgi:hypothetical protein
MEAAPKLVRELLLFSLVGFSPVLLLAIVLGSLAIIVRLRGRKGANAHDRANPVLRSVDALRIGRRIRRNRMPCLLLAPAETAAFSRLGGLPELPISMVWPENTEGQLRFLCQIDLASAAASGAPEWLPDAGRLYAFSSGDNGAPDQVRVFFTPAETELALVSPRDASAWPYEERPIGFVGQDSLPSLDWLGEDLTTADVSDEELDGLVSLSDPKWDGPLHKLGGYPDELQDEQMAITCSEVAGILESARQARRNWRLLLQIDADAELGTGFGGGRLYVFVRLADARRACFDRTVTLSQT